MNHVQQVLYLLSDSALSLKLQKCTFFTDKIDYLGYVIGPGKLESAAHTCDAIKVQEEPYNLTELRSFTASALLPANSYWTSLVSPANLTKGSVRISQKYLTILSKKKQTCRSHYKNTWHLIRISCFLAPKRRYIVDTETGDREIGAVICQKQPEGPSKWIEHW